MPSGRRRCYSNPSDARRAANQRAADRARQQGLVQRSVRLPKTCWERLRVARAAGETSDAQTLERLLSTLTTH